MLLLSWHHRQDRDEYKDLVDRALATFVLTQYATVLRKAGRTARATELDGYARALLATEGGSPPASPEAKR